jgi:Chaperone of endosialidase
MKFQSNSIFNGTITANSVADAGTNTDKFLVLNSSGLVTYRTAAELYADLGIGSLPAGYTSTVKHEVKAGETLSKGMAVYVSSSDGTNMIVSKASNASEATSSKTMGLLETALSTNGKGNVITEGLLAGLDTTGATNPGDPVWLGTGGNLLYGLANKPVAPAHMVFIGIVTRINANNGEIFVKVQNGFEMGELHNYAESGVANNDVITWESSTSLYKPKSIATILGYTPANPANFVTLSTLQTITGIKTFSNETIFGNGVTINGGDIVIASGSYDTNINTELLSASRNINFPDKSGVVALTSDVNAAVPTRTETVFTATANQSVFTVNYTVGAVEVFYNGSKMAPAEFTASNGTSITLASGIPAGTILTVVANGVGGGITKASLSATAPLVYDANTGAFSIPAASGSQDGYLSSANWTSFNNKVSSQWVTSGSDIYYSTGKVSIGASTIGRKLSIYSTTGDDHLLIAGTAPSVSMTDTMSGATYQAKWGLATSNGDFATGAVAGDFVISCQTGSTIWAANSVEKMRLNASGKLLIGTTSTASSSLLVVNGGITATTLVKSGGTSSQFLKADGSVDSSTYLTGITSGQVTGALGYTPYNNTNPSGYITNSIGSNFYINNSEPTIYLQDTNHRSSMIHCNSNIFYVLRGSGTNSTGWSTYNGYWPMELNLENNNATFGGNITAIYDVTAYSDARVKENVTTIEGALDKVLALRGVRYQRIDMEDRKFHIGVIAQETQPIVPEIVNENDKGHLNVAYGNMGGLFIEAIKELKKENNELRDILKRNNLI